MAINLITPAAPPTVYTRLDAGFYSVLDPGAEIALNFYFGATDQAGNILTNNGWGTFDVTTALGRTNIQIQLKNSVDSFYGTNVTTQCTYVAGTNLFTFFCWDYSANITIIPVNVSIYFVDFTGANLYPMSITFNY